MKDMDALLDKKLVEQFHNLESAVNEATADVIAKGKDATAYMQTKFVTTSPGQVSSYDVAVTYGEVLATATKQLNKFKNKHEEVMKDLDAYKEAAKKHSELKAQLTKLTHAYGEAEQAAKQAAVLATSVVPKENAVEQLRIEEQYKKEIADIDTKQKAQKEAEDKKVAAQMYKAEEELLQLSKKEALTGKKGVEAAEIELEWTKKLAAAKEAYAKKMLEFSSNSDEEQQNYDLVAKKNESEIKAAEKNLQTAKAAADNQ